MLAIDDYFEFSKKTRSIFKSTFKEKTARRNWRSEPSHTSSTTNVTEETLNTNPNLLSPFLTQTYHLNTE